VERHAGDRRGAVAGRPRDARQVCSIIELKDGKVWRQEQYDCFE